MRLVILSLALVACEQPPPAPTAGSTTATGSASAAVVPAPAGSYEGAKYTDEQMPVPADFEAEAEKKVTKENYKELLDELDEEIPGRPATSASASASASAAPAPPAPSK